MEKNVGGATLTLERELVVLIYDDNNILQGIEFKNKNSDQEIVKLEEKTPTPGDRLTVIDQLFSNLRRKNVDE